MNSKASVALEKAQADRRRSNFKKALSRLDEGIDKYPNELILYTEAIDIAMETGESLKALQYVKTAQRRLPEDTFEILTFASEKVGTYNDPIVGKFLVEHAIKSEDLSAAHAVVENLKEHTADDLLQRIRTKKQTLATAFGGGLSVKNDLVNNAITEALLCLRLHRLAEAMDGFVQVLDQKPELHGALEPLLAELERQHAENGELSFALGCCYLAGTKHEKGIAKIIRGAKEVPSLAEQAIQRIESLGDRPEFPAERRQLYLAELHIDKGEDLRAFDMLDPILKKNPTRAADILELLEPRVREISEPLQLHYLYVDAALAVGRRDTAISFLRRIYRIKSHRGDVIAWLDKKSSDRSTPVEVCVFFGEVALKEGMFGKAIEIFKEALSRGPQEESTIKELLSQHSSVPVIQHFLNERFDAANSSHRTTPYEFENYDRLEPSPSTPQFSGDVGPESSAKRGERGGEAEFTHDQFALGEAEAERTDDVGFDNRDFSLDMDGADSKTATPPAPAQSSPHEPHRVLEDSDLFDYLKRDFQGDTGIPANDPPATDPNTDAWGSPDHKEEQAPSVSAMRGEELEYPQDTPTMSAPETDEHTVGDHPSEETILPPLDEEHEPADFDSLYKDFEHGRLQSGQILDLISEAERTDRLEEMKTLLGFEPANLAEEFTRKCYLAKYYLALDRPLPALVVLKAVNPGGLSKEEQKELFLRMAECYQRMHNYEAAHSVFLRVVSDHPDIETIDKMAKLNYEKYLRAVSGEAPVLEKLTSL
ncbi:MAG: hypothetical protein JSW58_10230 [Candidatus Latescibacterota bacterium]|nr:MAG: hypothetical protein JSW58_10230 [Candidatus Latescibacterota bacterium]